ncbi:MAG: hypothetical protein Q8P28_04365 [Deltaproteobacteria bacterium]|nr:hypothetical protein [Deltaproteobacteria bacterium]
MTASKKKILNGSVCLDCKHRIVITLPPCWKWIEGKLSKEIQRLDQKYISKEIWKMNEAELDDKDKFDEACSMLTELYQPFFDGARRQLTSVKGKKYHTSLQKVALPY